MHCESPGRGAADYRAEPIQSKIFCPGQCSVKLLDSSANKFLKKRCVKFVALNKVGQNIGNVEVWALGKSESLRYLDNKIKHSTYT